MRDLNTSQAEKSQKSGHDFEFSPGFDARFELLKNFETILFFLVFGPVFLAGGILMLVYGMCGTPQYKMKVWISEFNRLTGTNRKCFSGYRVFQRKKKTRRKTKKNPTVIKTLKTLPVCTRRVSKAPESVPILCSLFIYFCRYRLYL